MNLRHDRCMTSFIDMLDAERGLAASEDRPYAIVQECELSWCAGAPLPTIIQWEFEAHLFFRLQDDGVGSIAFEHCRFTRFGPPGEDGHQLQGSGWHAYTALRVINSDWLRRMVGTSANLSHFVFPFHDTTFECIAESFRTSRSEGEIFDAVKATIDLRD